jgi:hypothetical protein
VTRGALGFYFVAISFVILISFSTRIVRIK